MPKPFPFFFSLLLFVLISFPSPFQSKGSPTPRLRSKLQPQQPPPPDRAFDASWENKDIPSESDRLLSQVETFFPREVKVYQDFGLTDSNLTIVDLGCGPGHLSAKLLRHFPTLLSYCVDIDPRLQDQGRKRYPDLVANGRLRFINGVASNTSLPGSIADVVIARLLLQHLNRKELKLTFHEVRRVLKTGGKFIITDADLGMPDIIEPEWEGYSILEEKRQEMKEKLGIPLSDIELGRKVWGLMESEGFTNIKSNVVMMHSKDYGDDLTHFINLNHPSIHYPVVKAGFMKKSLYASVMKQWEEYLKQQPFMISIMLTHCGEKLSHLDHTRDYHERHDEL